ncbi:EpsG family protein [Sulfurovum sp.]|uniref:EpsG family protein n=1 Tax=Sulfurovum sp. TaxID=1969726 RepID=UPI002867F0E1|nr:EpsG family protein [Sulfurovum sp.]
MFTFWLMYFIPASMALFGSRKGALNFLPWMLIGVVFTLLIGFRYEVGGDWFNYIRHYENVRGLSLTQALAHGDPGHSFLNWLSYRWDLGVYGTNVVYGAIFMIGLVKFSRLQTYPWISLAVAVPYLITVVAMGYSRQGVAIGLFMLAVTYLQKGSFKTYVVLIITAALFHKTALLLLPLGVFLYGQSGMTLRILMIVPVAYGAWDMLLAEQQERLWTNYVEANMQSDGAKIRVMMNLLPSLLLLIYRKEWKRHYDDYAFWFWIAIGSIISMALVGVASTAVDRVALYFIPIQLVVFARLPYLMRNKLSPGVTKVLIVSGYAMVLFVWLTFATHSQYWLPYQNVLSMDIF